MSDQMTKARLLELLRTKRAEWDATIASVPPSRMTEPGVAGNWSVKDIIAHITYFERWYADRMDERLHGIPYTPTDFDWMDFDKRNEIMYQKSKDKPLQDVLAESRQAFEKLIAGAEAHSEAFLIEPRQFEAGAACCHLANAARRCLRPLRASHRIHQKLAVELRRNCHAPLCVEGWRRLDISSGHRLYRESG